MSISICIITEYLAFVDHRCVTAKSKILLASPGMGVDLELLYDDKKAKKSDEDEAEVTRLPGPPPGDEADIGLLRVPVPLHRLHAN